MIAISAIWLIANVFAIRLNSTISIAPRLVLICIEIVKCSVIVCSVLSHCINNIWSVAGTAIIDRRCRWTAASFILKLVSASTNTCFRVYKLTICTVSCTHKQSFVEWVSGSTINRKAMFTISTQVKTGSTFGAFNAVIPLIAVLRWNSALSFMVHICARLALKTNTRF